MTIGIIEDDSLLNQALEIALQNAGYYTISAHTRKEALDLLREKVDVFLIDIGLPDGNVVSGITNGEKNSGNFFDSAG